MNKVNQDLLKYNEDQSAHFLSPDEVARRKMYRWNHKTLLRATMCMDGRINLSRMTDDEVPMAIVFPFRNMGGKFLIGSPAFTHHVNDFYASVERAVERGEAPGGLLFVTYHYSAGKPELGCKGFGYSTEAARKYTSGLKQEYEEVYGKEHLLIHPIHMGIETDHEAFVFHGDENGEVLDMHEVHELSPAMLKERLRALYPTMREGVLDDLMPFVLGNQRHVQKIIREQRTPKELEHSEKIIAVGSGHDWLYLYNQALIVEPFSVNWVSEVIVAAHIVCDNLKGNRIQAEDGVVLLVSVSYSEPGPYEVAARKKAEVVAQESLLAIYEDPRANKELTEKLQLVLGVLDRSTMILHRLPDAAERVLASAASRKSKV